ncbi:MAG: hypothetical protein R6U96_16515 [Promethearchaeia archaeon]
MKDKKLIKRIIKSFRAILKDIFDTSERRDFVKMIFEPECAEVVTQRMNEYFDSQEAQLSYNEHEIAVMRDGVDYLLENIRTSSGIMKMLFYTALFYEDNAPCESEINELLNNLN